MSLLALPPLHDVQKELAQRSLAHFLRLGWSHMDPNPFVSGWHLDAICEHLEAVSRGDLRRLIINIPPRMTKSLTTAVGWPAWTWLQDRDEWPEDARRWMGPGTQFMFSSYAAVLSTRDGSRTRRLIRSRWYQERWGDRFSILPDEDTKQKFVNDHGGYRLATSVDSMNTGEGGHIVVVDDPHNAKAVNAETDRESVILWWDETMSSRLNDRMHGAYVIIMQRLHRRDLTGYVLAKNNPDWTHLCLPMRYERDHPARWCRDPRKEDGELLCPARVDEKAAKELEADMLSYAAAGQLQQRPAPREGGMFKRAWFDQRVQVAPAGVRSVRGWDLAASDEITSHNPPWTATVRMYKDREGRFYLGGGWHCREQGFTVVKEIKARAKKDGKRVGVAIPQDPGQAGKTQAQDYIRLLAGYVVYTNTMSGSKEARAMPWAIQAQAGNVILIETGDPVEDAWIESFLDEACNFPNADFSDWVDAVSLAFEAIESAIVLPVVLPVGVDLVSPYAT